MSTARRLAEEARVDIRTATRALAFGRDGLKRPTGDRVTEAASRLGIRLPGSPSTPPPPAA